ncbi:MAG: hypothetical protein A2X05_17390 [Bacteroidetes bacterium GWE2_41_25]|nr:MAG: hypothetical protein A2X03_00825 [Bacteroidetes bacterium GWA2_40_15]OFX85164.1 MAG: hypothetical protein A2X06_12240 [Bacteroidetes bacterium GWC2_40_22]OFX96710.1 MAG: hypothetical protein A2X05_17390 [Bacteroidetes bacterium GWE2_41_25]OFY60864.1 MAG: hypothetical protein A2X04_01920 [Bacteroidetes bacterium GWF2_41_9]HAM08977.1 hypothetical protein [Bacteroidales bacterium]
MKMKKNDSKYIKTIDLLRKSKPLLDSSGDIEREVIRRISSSAEQVTDSFSLLDLLFGWTNIVWIRRGLIATSVMLVALFVYQQSVIVNQLNWISRQIVINEERPIRATQPEFVRQLKLLKITGGRYNMMNSSISEDQIEILIESVDKLQTDFDNLMKIIQDDPDLKELIEKKLNEKEQRKVKL